MKNLFSLILVLLWIQFAVGANFTIAPGDVAGLITAMNTANTNTESDVITLAAGSTYNISAVDNSDPMWGNSGLPKILNDFAGVGIVLFSR